MQIRALANTMEWNGMEANQGFISPAIPWVSNLLDLLGLIGISITNKNLLRAAHSLYIFFYLFEDIKTTFIEKQNID